MRIGIQPKWYVRLTKIFNAQILNFRMNLNMETVI
jgi:hypothetical protein